MRRATAIKLAAVPAALALGVTLTAGGPTPVEPADNLQGFTKKVLTTGLGDPYEIVWGPDDFIWATEKSGKKVTRIDPETGRRSTVLDLTAKAHHTEAGQDGVMGLALHPDLLKNKGRDYVYVSYTYDSNTSEAEVNQRLRIDRYTYDPTTRQLGKPKNLIAGLPSGSDHQSARMRFGPDGKLYYTIGDQGANQLQHFCDPNRAQQLPTQHQIRAKDWIAYQGKTLRLNPDDGSIPEDNPTLGGVRSHIWTFGHRNAQGLDFGPDGTLYQGEQGPKTDDEVNILTKGANYGWPYVAGYRDDKAYAYRDWSAASPTPCADLTYNDVDIPKTVPTQKESAWPGQFTEPITTFGTVPSTFDFTDPKCGPPAEGLIFICWPSIANSSLTYYPGSGAIAKWRNSLLMTTLKDGSVYQLELTDKGQDVGKVTRMWTSQNRYRDVAFSPDGKTVYVATDSSGLVRTDDGAPTTELENPGAILAFTRD